MRNLSFICWILLLMDFSPSGHVKSNDEYNMARIEQYSGMNVFVAVSDGVKTMVVMEGDSVTLNANVTEIKRDDTILWMFEDDDSIIANMNEAAGIYNVSVNERFRDRLELDKQTGSLTIINIRTQHTGLYQLKIKSTTEKSQKFSVTVRELPPSSVWQTVGPVLAVIVVILIVGIGIFIAMKKCQLQVCCMKSGETKTEGETLRKLKSETDSSS